MTAEIAIINRLGVALAADSAVTIGDDAKKIYSSADKLFHLSKNSLVAIMISGNAKFLGFPWETIIKAYGKEINLDTCSRLSDYSEGFFNFICSKKEIFTPTIQDYGVNRIIYKVFYDVMEIAKDQYEEIDDESIHEIVAEMLSDVLDDDNEKILGLNSDATEVLLKRYKKGLEEHKEQIFGKCSISEKTKNALDNLVVETLLRTNNYMDAGVVFAGFGDDDYVPACLEYKVGGMVLNKLRSRLNDETQMTKFVGAIQSFGQTEIIDTFTGGVSPAINKYLRNEYWKFALRVRNFAKTHGSLTDDQVKEIALLMREEWKKIQGVMIERKKKLWPRPLEMVKSLPKGEMVEMAEMLINLTKFYMRMSDESETVGGPIDVALITKGDGFKWIKRKSFYPPELNNKL